MFVCKHFFEPDAQIAKHFSMGCTDVQLEICPSIAKVVAIGVRTVETQQN